MRNYPLTQFVDAHQYSYIDTISASHAVLKSIRSGLGSESYKEISTQLQNQWAYSLDITAPGNGNTYLLYITDIWSQISSNMGTFYLKMNAVTQTLQLDPINCPLELPVTDIASSNPLSSFIFSHPKVYSWLGATQHKIWQDEWELNLSTVVALLSRKKVSEEQSAEKIKALSLLFEAGINAGLKVSMFDLYLVDPCIRSSYVLEWFKQNAISLGRGTGDIVLSYIFYGSISLIMGHAANVSLSWALSYSVLKATDLFGNNKLCYGKDYNRMPVILSSFAVYLLAASIAMPTSYGVGLIVGTALNPEVLATTQYMLFDTALVFLLYGLASKCFELSMYEMCNTMVISIEDGVAHAVKHSDWANKISSTFQAAKESISATLR